MEVKWALSLKEGAEFSQPLGPCSDRSLIQHPTSVPQSFLNPHNSGKNSATDTNVANFVPFWNLLSRSCIGHILASFMSA